MNKIKILKSQNKLIKNYNFLITAVTRKILMENSKVKHPDKEFTLINKSFIF